MVAVKEEAKKMVENLPENATWDDLMYQLYVRKKVEKALKQAENGEIVSHEEVKKRLLSKWYLNGLKMLL